MQKKTQNLINKNLSSIHSKLSEMSFERDVKCDKRGLCNLKDVKENQNELIKLRTLGAYL